MSCPNELNKLLDICYGSWMIQQRKRATELKAAQILKKYLRALEHLLKSRQTTPGLHKAITEVLRKYWQS